MNINNSTSPLDPIDRQMTDPAVKSDPSDSDLLVIHEAAKLISHAGSPDYAIKGIMRMMSQMLGLNRGRVVLPLSYDRLHIRYSYGLTDEEHKRGVYSLGEGISGKVMESGQLIVIQNIDEEPGFLFRAVERKTLPPETVAFIAVPIMDGNQPIGVLGTHRIRERLRPLDADLMILRTFATFIAQILKVQTLIKVRTDQLTEENRELKDALTSQQNNHGVLGESDAMREALNHTKQVADSNVTVLLTGESGTGKERFSQLLHLWSSRKNKAFVAINCAAIPEQLLESELFGHDRGAFTGAVATKPGKFELANGGTLLLDEIGDLTLELQTKLLRVLETQTIQRVGGAKEIPVDVRIIAATHKQLMSAVNEGKFRLDLFYRLNVFPIHLPALRERTGDVEILARYFLLMANKEYNRQAILNKSVMECLVSYDWPGNIRQLENVIKRAVLISSKGTITKKLIENILFEESQVDSRHANSPVSTPELLPHTNQSSFRSNEQAIPYYHGINRQPKDNQNTPDTDFTASEPLRPYSWVSEDEAELIVEALKAHKGNKTRAASSIGMTARQLRYRMQKLGVEDY